MVPPPRALSWRAMVVRKWRASSVEKLPMVEPMNIATSVAITGASLSSRASPVLTSAIQTCDGADGGCATKAS